MGPGPRKWTQINQGQLGEHLGIYCKVIVSFTPSLGILNLLRNDGLCVKAIYWDCTSAVSMMFQIHIWMNLCILCSVGDMQCGGTWVTRPVLSCHNNWLLTNHLKDFSLPSSSPTPHSSLPSPHSSSPLSRLSSSSSPCLVKLLQNLLNHRNCSTCFYDWIYWNIIPM